MIGVVADDTTGANDIGLMFAKHHLVTQVAAADSTLPLRPDLDVLVLDTDSRFDSPAAAYRKVHAATRRLRALQCSPLYKKTCSVFRGNVGAEFDAMLDASGEKGMVVSVAYPKNGRETRQGVHYVHGARLDASPFRHDPVHPARESNLAGILAQQSRRPADVVGLETVRQGPGPLRTALAARRSEHAYCIVDAARQEDISTLAEAARDAAVFGGSAALAEELPRFWPARPLRDLLAGFDGCDAHGVLMISGSLTPQTRAQTETALAAGLREVRLDSRLLLNAATRQAEVERAVAIALPALRAGRDVLVAASQDDAVVAETKRSGAEMGLDSAATGRVISASLADVALAVVEATGLKRLIVAGGDTSGAVCRRLGIQGNLVLHEVATGVPSGLALGRPILCVLKSGSFGAPDFLLQAAAHLKSLARTPFRP